MQDADESGGTLAQSTMGVCLSSVEAGLACISARPIELSWYQIANLIDDIQRRHRPGGMGLADIINQWMARNGQCERLPIGLTCWDQGLTCEGNL